VRVSGVQIGQIGNVSLKNGVAIVGLQIDEKYKHLIHTDATALLRPRTGLKDMFVELSPGSPAAPIVKPGFTIPVSNTMPDVNADEVLASLDTDTREYLNLLINGAGQGLKNNGGNQLAQVFERFEPTHRDLARLNGAVAQRGRDLQQLINSLARLNTAVAQKQTQIVSLVNASARVFRAFASQGANVSRAVADLPGTLAQTTSTLQKVQTFSQALVPASIHLLPAANALPSANAAVTALAKPAAPIIQHQIRPFVVAARPVVRDLKPAAVNLAAATPNLSATFGVLNHLFNLLGYSPGGNQHGYLWWLAWLDHNARTLFSVQDANGVFRPLFLQFSCQQLGMLANPPAQLGGLQAVAGLLNTAPANAACQAAGLGTNNPSGGLPPLPPIPPLPLGLSKDKSSKASAHNSAARTSSASSSTGSGH
jgi:phospholipid/cholesterol/gamma-HCH transport system substrate-binding protein